ncbi:UNVERIFIED_CONTAM: hypothetical protein K2H54_066306 [Gekko kuhli]
MQLAVCFHNPGGLTWLFAVHKDIFPLQTTAGNVTGYAKANFIIFLLSGTAQRVAKSTKLVYSKVQNNTQNVDQFMMSESRFTPYRQGLKQKKNPPQKQRVLRESFPFPQNF